MCSRPQPLGGIKVLDPIELPQDTWTNLVMKTDHKFRHPII